MITNPPVERNGLRKVEEKKEMIKKTKTSSQGPQR